MCRKTCGVTFALTVTLTAGCFGEALPSGLSGAAHRTATERSRLCRLLLCERPAVLPADDRKRAQIAAAVLLLPGTLGGEPFGKLRRDGD